METTHVSSTGMNIKDSGTRRDFGTGSVRDAATGKGRMDLLPVFAMEELVSFCNSGLIQHFCSKFVDAHGSVLQRLQTASWHYHMRAVRGFQDSNLTAAAWYSLWALDFRAKVEREAWEEDRFKRMWDRQVPWEGLIELSKLYEAGCLKYGDRNWELGQPLRVYLDSGARHLAKSLSGWVDEDHLVAAAWNQMCCIETSKRISGNTLPASLREGLATLPKRIDANESSTAN